MARLDRCINIADLRLAARRALPPPMYHYLEGGADDEVSARRNIAAFDDYELIPTQLNGVSSINLKTRLLGKEMALPFFLAPTGMSRLFHHDKEFGVARAAAAAGIFYSLSTVGTALLEGITGIAPLKIFQLYILKDRELTKEFVARCKAAGYDALCLTVDTPIAGNRERDLRVGMTLPPRFGPKELFGFAMKPGWSLNFLKDPDIKLVNVAHRVDALADQRMSLVEYVNSQFDRSLTWKDVEWLAGEWGGPLIIKGLMSAGDARKARASGASAVMISNHGGRQLEGTPAPIDCLKSMRDAVGRDLELIVDGGVRRGTHIVKAMVAGADAVSVGRAYLYGLAAGGEAGVARAIEILRSETERTMALLGCNDVAALPEFEMRRRGG